MRKKNPHYFSWGIFLFLLLCAAGYSKLANRGDNISKVATPLSTDPGINSFLLLRMPEITSQYESGVETMKRRMDEWIAAIQSAGFHPMLLSEVSQRLKGNQGLPENTVVLFFGDGFRKTYEIVEPIFSRRDCPVVWFTNKSAMQRSDRRYLTFHAIRLMRSSGKWDIAFTDNTGQFHIENDSDGQEKLPAELGWSSVSGALALNQGNDFRHLNFLTVNSDWNPTELVSRLKAETPAVGKVILTKALIHTREWGIAERENTTGSNQFSLETPANKRGSKLYWLSTAGCRDFNVDLSVGSLIGELWLQMRYDEAAGNDIHLILSGKDIVVGRQDNHSFKVLQSFRLESPFNGRPFAMQITLKGNDLSINIDGKAFRTVCSDTYSSSGKEMLQMYVTGRMRGIARVNDVRIAFTPANDKTVAHAQ